MAKERTVFLHGINMAAYNGYEENIHPGGFRFPLEHGFGYEIFNFSNVGGRCYGYVEVPTRNGNAPAIDLSKLGALESADSLDGVLAVWTAPCREGKGREVVGWYRNATIHRHYIRPTSRLAQARRFNHPQTGEPLKLDYRIEAEAEDCVLLHPEQRVLRISVHPRKPGLPGMSSVYFPFRQNSNAAKELRKRVLEFVNDSGTRTSKPGRPKKGRPRPGQDPERRRQIEQAAVTFVQDYFGKKRNGLGYEIKDRQHENVGYDLLMSKCDLTLCVEVKGRSGDEVLAEFTRNESRAVREAQEGKFGDGDYRVCIVTDALNERGNRQLHHFSWWKKEGSWIKVDGSDRLSFLPSGSTVAKLEE